MSKKHIGTAADLVRFGASVRIDCGKCGATKTLSGAQMVKACGAGDLRASERRLKCSRCGGKEAWLTILPSL
jgi:ribosomal protein S27AE